MAQGTQKTTKKITLQSQKRSSKNISSNIDEIRKLENQQRAADGRLGAAGLHNCQSFEEEIKVKYPDCEGRKDGKASFRSNSDGSGSAANEISVSFDAEQEAEPRMQAAQSEVDLDFADLIVPRRIVSEVVKAMPPQQALELMIVPNFVDADQ